MFVLLVSEDFSLQEEEGVEEHHSPGRWEHKAEHIMVDQEVETVQPDQGFRITMKVPSSITSFY